jgi:hypothetical protein
VPTRRATAHAPSSARGSGAYPPGDGAYPVIGPGLGCLPAGRRRIPRHRPEAPVPTRWASQPPVGRRPGCPRPPHTRRMTRPAGRIAEERPVMALLPALATPRRAVDSLGDSRAAALGDFTRGCAGRLTRRCAGRLTRRCDRPRTRCRPRPAAHAPPRRATRAGPASERGTRNADRSPVRGCGRRRGWRRLSGPHPGMLESCAPRRRGGSR